MASKSTESIQSSGTSEEKRAGKLKFSVQYDSLRRVTGCLLPHGFVVVGDSSPAHQFYYKESSHSA